MVWRMVVDAKKYAAFRRGAALVCSYLYRIDIAAWTRSTNPSDVRDRQTVVPTPARAGPEALRGESRILAKTKISFTSDSNEIGGALVCQYDHSG
jgi:hypothetical protein